MFHTRYWPLVNPETLWLSNTVPEAASSTSIVWLRLVESQSRQYTGGNRGTRTEEHTADHSISAGGSCNSECYMATDAPYEVLAVGKPRDAPAIQHRAGSSIQHVDGLAAARGVPVQTVDRHL